jgi:enoyl-CoA hydratase/3-hydroxyacyl-CoA dehydrogenase
MFGQPEIKLGIVPGFGGTQRLPRLVGIAKAFEMNAVGDPVLADEAWELGLASRLVDDHELHDSALTWARQLAARPARALAAIKALGADASLAAGIEAEKTAFESVIATDDASEGIAAFLAKRPARFTGS